MRSFLGIGNEVQNEKRKSAVKFVVRIRQRCRVALFEFDAIIRSLSARKINVCLGKIDASYFCTRKVFAQGEG